MTAALQRICLTLHQSFLSCLFPKSLPPSTSRRHLVHTRLSVSHLYLALSATYRRFLLTQLEQTGSTIFQTLAGVALDIKTKKKAAAEAVTAPVNGDATDIQYLLNAFLLLNVVQFGGLIALARLDRKQKRAAARRMAALLPATQEDEDETDVSSSGGPSKLEDEWQRNDTSSPVLGKSATGTVRSLRGIGVASPSTSTATEQSIPLLRSPSVASSARTSRYLSFAPGQTPVKVVRSKKELRRGEVFAFISGLSIAFAWILFMGVAYFRLRSKEERTSEMLY